MAKVVALLVDGKLTNHAAGMFNYATLCGLDGDDSAVGQAAVPVMPGAVIDCDQCFAMWQAWGAYRVADFKRRKAPRRTGR